MLPKVYHHSRDIKQYNKKHRNHHNQLKKIFGEHYNYSYQSPNQKVRSVQMQKMYHLQQNRNTEIQRENRILLQKIRKIHARSGPYAQDYTYYIEIDQSQPQDNQTKVPIRRQKYHKNDYNNINQLLQAENRKNHKSLQNASKNNLLKQRRKTQEILIKPSGTRIKTLNKPCNRNNLQSSIITKKQQQIPKYQLIYNEKYPIDNYYYHICIVINETDYQIQAQKLQIIRGKQQKLQKIMIPIEDYKILLNTLLKGDHLNILKYLEIGKDSGLLEIRGFNRQSIQIKQQGNLLMKQVSKKDPKLNIKNNNPETTPYLEKQFGFQSSRRGTIKSEYSSDNEQISVKPIISVKGKKKKKNRQTYNTISLVDV